ncbi:MAG: PSD1 and planctomycete cytochrome C domain-containing protein [Pirellulales bacterium]
MRWSFLRNPHRVYLAILATVALSHGSQSVQADDQPATKLPPAAARQVDFVKDIQPLLARCTNCHGIEMQEAGLNLQVKKGALLGGDNGKVILPGKSDKSRLVMAVSRVDPELMMPPEGEGQPLTAEQVGFVRAWIDQGAKWPDAASVMGSGHWAYQKPVRREPPPIADDNAKQGGWPRNVIDSFVLARLLQEGLHPSPELDRVRLIRRVSLDLIGLPPTPEEVDAFVNDQASDAYEKIVDRLLASQHYGERWARPWLDLARYADTHGFEKDPRRTIWPYRDWVINALNQDMPFDQFTIEQLAGDLLPNATLEQRIATGFHRNTMINTEGGVDPEEYRVAAVVDRVNTTATVWLGTTLACAQCHTHKYDPFTQQEYYQFFAFFNSNADKSTSDGDMLLLPTPEQQAPLDEIAQLEAVQSKSPELKEVRDRLAAAKKKLNGEVAKTLVMKELPEPRETFVHVRGNFLNKGDKVEPGVPEVLHELNIAEGETPSRLTLARWLVSPDNPLTARVVVNRMWEAFFDRGLVETSEDFGSRGERPMHPDLLDWLSTEFIREGWSMKRLQRLIVLSATYRQAANVTPELLERDPHNRLLARGPRMRLSAEAVRDQALAVSGLLSRKIGGPSVMPPQPEGLWNSPYSSEKWQTSSGEDKYRRGLYTFWKRTSPYPSFMSFDAPSREFCVVRRPRTNTPLQALTLLNDPVYVEAAQALARRMMNEGGDEMASRASLGVRLVLSRAPQPAEVERLVALYEGELVHYRQDANAAESMAGKLDRKQSEEKSEAGAKANEFDTAELAAWTVVANVLLNLDEAVTK